MARKATTFRLAPETQAALAALSEVRGRPQNQLVNEAVEELLSKRGPAERNLEATLNRLRAFRMRDPTGVQSMAGAMAAEAAVEDDPAEGDRVSPVRPAGPVSARVLGRLGG